MTRHVCNGPRRLVRVGSALLVVAALIAVSAVSASAASSKRGPAAVAMFEGRAIDLASGWQGAQSCLVWPEVLTTVECFSSEAGLKTRVVQLGGTLPGQSARSASSMPFTSSGGGATTASASCSSFVRLYDGVFYTGASLWLSSRSTWLNLSSLGFDQRTSSFKIGACSAYFADYSNGGGAWYPTWATQAWHVAPWMASGWDNDVSSVFIS